MSSTHVEEVQEDDEVRGLSSLTTREVSCLLARLSQCEEVKRLLTAKAYAVTGEDLLYLQSVEDLVELGLGDVLPKFKLRKLVEDLLILQKKGEVSLALIGSSAETSEVVQEVVEVVERESRPKDVPEERIADCSCVHQFELHQALDNIFEISRNSISFEDINVHQEDFCRQIHAYLLNYSMLYRHHMVLLLDILYDIWMCEVCANTGTLLQYVGLQQISFQTAQHIKASLQSLGTDSELLRVFCNHASKIAELDVEVLKKLMCVLLAIFTSSPKESMFSVGDLKSLQETCLLSKAQYESNDEMYFMLTLLEMQVLLVLNGENCGKEVLVLEKNVLRILEAAETDALTAYVKLAVLHLSWKDINVNKNKVLSNKVWEILSTTNKSVGEETGKEKVVLGMWFLVHGQQCPLSEHVESCGSIWGTALALSSKGKHEGDLLLMNFLSMLHTLLDGESRQHGNVSWSVFGTIGMMTFFQLCCDRLKDITKIEIFAKTSKLILDLMLKIDIVGPPSVVSVANTSVDAFVVMEACFKSLQQAATPQLSQEASNTAYGKFTHLVVSILNLPLVSMMKESPAHMSILKKTMLCFFAWMNIPVLQKLLRDSKLASVHVMDTLLACQVVFTSAKAHDERWIWLRLRYLQVLSMLLRQNPLYQDLFWLHGNAWLAFLQASIEYLEFEKEVKSYPEVLQVLVLALGVKLRTTYTQSFVGLQINSKATLPGGLLVVEDMIQDERYLVDDILGIAVQKKGLELLASQLMVPSNELDGNGADTAMAFFVDFCIKALHHNQQQLHGAKQGSTEATPCGYIEVLQLMLLWSFDANLAQYLTIHWKLPSHLTQSLFQYALTPLFPRKTQRSPLKPLLNLQHLSLYLGIQAVICRHAKLQQIPLLEDSNIVTISNPSSVSLGRLVIQILRVYPKDLLLVCYYFIFQVCKDIDYAWEFSRILPCFLESNHVATLHHRIQSQTHTKEEVIATKPQEEAQMDEAAAREELKLILTKTSFKHKYILLVVLVMTIIGLLLPRFLKKSS